MKSENKENSHMASVDRLSPSCRAEPYWLGHMIETEINNYAILLNEPRTRYYPILILKIHRQLIETILGDDRNAASKLGLAELGMFHSLSVLFRAHKCVPNHIAVEPSHGSLGIGAYICYMELVQSNDVETCMSRVPLLLSDAIMVSVLEDIPFMIFDMADKPMTVPVRAPAGSDEAGQIQSITDEIVSMEEAIRSGMGLTKDKPPQKG